MHYNQKLKELRKKLGFTQTKMAQVLGVSQTSVSQHEAAETYPVGKALRKYIELARSIKYPLKIEELIRE